MQSPLQPSFRAPSPRDVERWAFECEISVTELYRRAGVDPSGFGRWKQAESTPLLATVAKLYETAAQLYLEKSHGEDANGARSRSAAEKQSA